MSNPMRWAIAAGVLASLGFGLPAHAGTLSDVTLTNHSVDGSDSHGAPSCAQTTTAVAIQSQTGTSFATRFQQGIDADSRLTTAISISESTSYTINFNAFCPIGPYKLYVDTSLKGAFTIVDDSSGCGAAGTASVDLSGVNGSFTAGTLSGSLSLTDPGGEYDVGARDVGFSRSASATISNTSSGSAIAHSLTFAWDGSAASNATAFTCGLEGAVRLGLGETFSPCQGLSSTTDMTADDYPNGRVQETDGHFVSVTLECICGNGQIDNGEACDNGALNGQEGSCCTSTCTILPQFATCRSAVSSCDIAETCGGISGVCPPDLTKSNGTACASDGNDCTQDVCDGTANGCTHPNQADGVSCNGGAGSCDGSGNCGGLYTPTPTPSPTPTSTPPNLCAETPISNCRAPGLKKSTLAVSYSPGRDKLKWKWTRGASTSKADFGDPLNSTNYTLCVYQSTGGAYSLANALRIPAAANCFGRSCWKDTSAGFSYSNSFSTPDGLYKLVLKAGLAGKASIKAQAHDPNLNLLLPTHDGVLKQDPSVVVQLVNDLPTAKCWEARYSSPAKRNDFENFKDISD